MKFLIKLFICVVIFSNPIYSQIFFSEYSEGSSYNKYLEIYNYSDETIDLYPNFVLASCTNGCLDGNNFYINVFTPLLVVFIIWVDIFYFFLLFI